MGGRPVALDDQITKRVLKPQCGSRVRVKLGCYLLAFGPLAVCSIFPPCRPIPISLGWRKTLGALLHN